MNSVCKFFILIHRKRFRKLSSTINRQFFFPWSASNTELTINVLAGISDEHIKGMQTISYCCSILQKWFGNEGKLFSDKRIRKIQGEKLLFNLSG